MELARAGKLTTYGQIAPLAGLSMDVEKDRATMSELLREILEHELSQSRPVLPAIVVHKGEDNNPGEGFFSIVTELGLYRRLSQSTLATPVLG